MNPAGWSWRTLALPGLLAALFVLAVALADAHYTLLPLLGLMLGTALVTALRIGSALFERRPGAAASLAAGLALLALGPIAARTLSPMIRNASWSLQRGAFDARVAAERARGGAPPLRMVVAYRDQTGFATNTPLFEYVVYDAAEDLTVTTTSLTGYWPDPTSPTGKRSLSGAHHRVWNLRHDYFRIMVTL